MVLGLGAELPVRLPPRCDLRMLGDGLHREHLPHPRLLVAETGEDLPALPGVVDVARDDDAEHDAGEPGEDLGHYDES